MFSKLSFFYIHSLSNKLICEGGVYFWFRQKVFLKSDIVPLVANWTNSPVRENTLINLRGVGLPKAPAPAAWSGFPGYVVHAAY